MPAFTKGYLVLVAFLAIYAAPTWSDAQEKIAARQDRSGDPLPAGALARMGTVRLRHDHVVQTVAFAPDGKTLASGGNDFRVCLWDAGTGRLIREFRRSAEQGGAYAAERLIHQVAFSPDGSTLAASLGDNSVWLWQVATGKELRKIQGHQGPIPALAFAPDGKMLATGGADQNIHLWDVTSGKSVGDLAAEEPVAALLFLEDGRTLVSAGSYGSLRVWQAATGRELRLIEAHRGAINGLALSPDGKTVASVGQDKLVRLWNLAQEANPNFAPYVWLGLPCGQNRGFLPLVQGLQQIQLGREAMQLGGHKDEVTCVAFAHDRRRLITGSLDGSLRIWDLANGKVITVLDDTLGPVHCLALSRDGTRLASGDSNSAIRLWQTANWQEVTPGGGHRGPVQFCRFLDRGETLLTAGKDHTVRKWRCSDGAEVPGSVRAFGQVTSLCVCPDHGLAAWSAVDGVHWCRLDNKQEVHSMRNSPRFVSWLVFSPDSKLLAGAVDKVAHLWETGGGMEIDQLRGAESSLTFLAFSPDGKVLAGVTTDQTIHIWETQTGKELWRLTENGADVDCVTFSPDGRWLASGSQDGTARLWDMETGKLLHQFPGHPGHVLALAFSADGKAFACGSWLTVRLWEVASGGQRLRFDGQRGDVTALAFSPDDRVIGAGNSGTTVLLLDLMARKPGAEQSPLTEKDLEGLWRDLAAKDAGRAYRSIWALTASGNRGVSYLRPRLAPVRVLEPEQQRQVEQWIAQLGGDDFAGREKAAQALEKAGPAAEPLLARALQGGLAPEARHRLDEILDKLHGSTLELERLRETRAVETLEKIATPQALEVLNDLARGSDTAPLTRDARQAVQRLTTKGR
jgi:WD40 repeat protein